MKYNKTEMVYKVNYELNTKSIEISIYSVAVD